MATALLENDLVRVGVKSHGAELCSFFKKDGSREYLWQAHPEYWNRHAPVLFPVVGKLPENQYLHQGQTYKMQSHGFARDQAFELLEQTQNQLVYELTQNEETLQHYPFHFSLRITYTLRDQTLEVKWHVQHKGEGEMFFSIGAHPAFCVPLLPGGNFEDYYLEFSQPETLSRLLLDEKTGLFNGQTEPMLDNMAQLPLRYAHYSLDAIVFEGFQSEGVTIKCDQHPHFMKMTFKGFPYLGIWTKGAGAPFLCIEPWFGLAGSVGEPVELSEKEGIQSIGQGEIFEAAYTIAIG